jgi:hypothetical protein
MTVRLTMRLGTACEVVTLYGASETLTFAGSDHIHTFTHGENVRLHNVTHRNIRAFGAKLAQDTQGRQIGTLEVAKFTTA